MKRAFRSGVDTTVAFLNLVNSKLNFYKVDLLQIAMPDLGYPTPLTLRYALGDVTINFEGQTWTATADRWSRGTTKTVLGTEADQMDLTAYPTPTDLLPPAHASEPTLRLPMPEAIATGVFQDAVVTLRTLFAPAPPTPLAAFDDSAGAVTMFGGRIREWDLVRGMAKFKVYSWLEALNVPMPRNLYQPGCPNTLYDAVCGASRTGVTPAGGFEGEYPFVPGTPVFVDTTVGSGSDASTVVVSSLGTNQFSGFFDLGTLQVRSGLLAGLTRQVKTMAGVTVVLQRPLPRAPLPGVAVHLQAGCDKTLKTCVNKFNRLAGFRGMPYIPPADNAF